MSGKKARQRAARERFNRWVDSMGGSGSEKYRALCREALEFAGPGDVHSYLDMARQLDEDHQAHKRARQGRERVEAAVQRRRSGAASRAASAAATAAMRRNAEIRLAVEAVAAHPRLAADPGDPDFSTRAPMTRAEVDSELRALMGLANRMPDTYRATMPPVGDLARTMGLKR